MDHFTGTGILRRGGICFVPPRRSTPCCWGGLIVLSLSNIEPMMRRAMLERAMEARGNRALLMMDLGVPCNDAADAADLYNTYLYNVDDLTEIVEQNKKAREAEIPRAEAIINEQIEKFMHWQAGVAAGEGACDHRTEPVSGIAAFLRVRHRFTFKLYDRRQ